MSIVYSDPVKLNDGRYFVKASTGDSPVYVSLKNVVVHDPTTDDIEIRVSEGDALNISNFDKTFVDDAVTNSEKWFSKKIGQDVISSYYQSSLDGDTLETQPVVNSKGKVAVALFDSAKNQVQKVDVDTAATVLLQFEGLWFLRKTFGPVWRLVQVRVKKTLEPVQCMLDDDSD
jgi:hypothetical protein